MEKKATFLYSERNRWYNILWYEYRGRKYTVNTGLYTPLAAQHRMEQASIDAAIECEERRAAYEAEHPARYEDTAQAGFDLFWAYVNGETDEL